MKSQIKLLLLVWVEILLLVHSSFATSEGSFVQEGVSWATEKDAAALTAEIRDFFKGSEVRVPGSPGNLAMEEKIARRFAESGLEHGEIRFQAPSFLPGKTTLSFSSHGSIRLLPMHPTLFRPGNFKKKAFSANLVYLDRGTENDLMNVKGISLRDAVVLMEFNCGDDWQRLLRFGVKGFIFIGGDKKDSRNDSILKVYTTEVAVPRFFIAQEDGTTLKNALSESGNSLQVSIRAEPSRWENRFLRDLWALIPGSDPELEKEVILILAPIDSNCIVPQLATGTQSGANLSLLMKIFDEFRKRPPARSVLIAAVNAHTQRFLGERMLAWHVLAPSHDVEAARDVMAFDIRVQELVAKTYSGLNLDGKHDGDDEKFLIDLKKLSDKSTGKHIMLKDPIVTLARRDVNQLKFDQMRLAHQDISDAELEKRRVAMEKDRDKYVNVLILFNKVGIQTELSDLSPDELKILKRYVREIIENNTKWARKNRRDLEISSNNSAVRKILAGRSLPLVISLDLNWQNKKVGFSSFDPWGRTKWPYQFGKNVVRIAAGMKMIREEGKKNLLVDTLTNVGGMPQGHFFFSSSSLTYSSSPGVALFQAAQDTPAFSLANVFADEGRIFSPADTFENLSAENVAEIFFYIPEFLRHLFNDPRITAPSELDKPGISATSPLWSVRIKSFKFDEFSPAVLPSLPVPGSVIILPLELPPIIAGDVINSYISLTDERAVADFYGISRNELVTMAFHFDEDFINIDHAIDAGEVHERVDSNLVKSEQLVLALFHCTEFPIYELNDSSLIGFSPIQTSSFLIMDARRNSSPRKYGFTGISSVVSKKTMPGSTAGPAAVFIEPQTRLKLLTGTKRLALNASETEPEGKGYGTSAEMGPDFFRAAIVDMSHLNHKRTAGLRGVSDKLVDSFLEEGDKKLLEVNETEAGHDHIGYLRALYEAFGAQVKAYEQISTTRNDMLKAVVFYMALMLPFCFFLQRLLFSTVRIEAQMGIFMVLFIFTYVVFRFIHPAFRIAKAPEAMFIAFVMGMLGLFVVNILHSRFEGEMQFLFRTYAGMDEGQVGYSTVGQQAMLIGVNNMKRRRIRTALTTGTIVLVTFTMLAFTSVSRKLSPTIIARAKFAPYTGIMYHWLGLPMDESTMRVFRELFTGKGKTIVRRWLLARRIETKWEQKVQLLSVEAVPSGRKVNLEAALGLPSADDGFLEKMPLIPGGRFFLSDDANEAVIPASIADTLDITPGNLQESKIIFNGHELDVVGILDDERFRSIKDINNQLLLPVKSILEKAETQEDEVEKSSVLYVDMSSLIIFPVETCRTFGGKPFSISVRFKDNEPIWPVMKRLLTITRANFYMSSRVPFQAGDEGERLTNAGVYYVGSGYRTSIGGLARLIIPLLIASTLVMNTMLGSVFERKPEIAIYNAIGLNPNQIGTFFLAEAFVYAIIGSVGGYLIGQVLSITLNRFGLVSDINLNFSSLSVVYVILFTIAIVLLSTLYPAIAATRVAVPSGKRKWSMPLHDGNRMEVAFPFIYQPNLLAGVMNYLEEYLARYTEASLGDVIAELEEKSKGRDESGRDTYDLKYHVALAPYDLGVTQKVHICAAYDKKVQAHRIVMNISRVSGQDSNWVTTNRPFLERLRQYLMHWRNLDSAQHALFVEQGNRLFGG